MPTKPSRKKTPKEQAPKAAGGGKANALQQPLRPSEALAAVVGGAAPESGGAKIPSVTGRWLSTPMSADPAAGVSLLSGVGAGPPPDGV
jgi:hypothetical protein